MKISSMNLTPTKTGQSNTKDDHFRIILWESAKTQKQKREKIKNSEIGSGELQGIS